MKRPYQTGDQTLVRTMNLSVVLNCLRERAPLSRAQLAEITGLNKTTVSSLVGQLLQHQFVREIGCGPSSSGRPGVLLELNPNAGSIVGLEIGVDFILLLLTDFKAQTLWRWEERNGSDKRPEWVIQQAGDIVERALAQSRQLGLSVLGLGVGVPGLVDVTTGTVLFAPNLQWHDVPLEQELTKRFSIPVLIDNDANTAALGEKYFGVAQASENFIYLSAGVGLGGGIFIADELYRGQRGYAGEVGHMTIVENGLLCNCGSRGCLETLVSQTAVLNRVRQAIERGQASSLAANGDLASIGFAQVLHAAEAGDAVARTALEETGQCLGVGVANLVNAFNPEIVVLGGILSRAGEFILPLVEKTLRERLLCQAYEQVQVKISAHGFDACVMGGVALVLNNIMRQESLAAQV